MPELSRLLPRPGPVWGAYPLRPAADAAPPWRGLRRRSAAAQCRAVARAAARHASAWSALGSGLREPALPALRRALRRDGLTPPRLAEALGVVAACAATTLGWSARDGQLRAAAALLDGRMVEMATGEGKTLATALAAAVAALAGIPVHVVTANDYLAARDAARLAPLFAALGLRVAARPGAADDDARRTVYRHDVVYATAKDLAFDFLRDRQGAVADAARAAGALSGKAEPVPLLRGLCMALLDEADSILLDEAVLPLVLSRGVAQPARRAFLWQALSLARQLEPGRDFTLQRDERQPWLTPAGEARVAELAAALGGPWQRPRYRREAIGIALAGLHAQRRDEHYVVRDGRIELLDTVTGRIAPGRVWSRGLQTVVALKEGLRPDADTETVAQITFQRFFQRYWRLAGISGTLYEARAELREVYGTGIVAIAPHRPCRRRTLAPRVFADAAQGFAAAVERIAALQRDGRPVLVGTDSVADSQRLSALLHAHGVAHRVLNALHDADEAAIVAEAGRAGRVTVATRMAGRGTDIELDDAARAAGGLHVLSCQRNASRRIDRQLAGRAARHGDPGSAEEWYFATISDDRAAPPSPTLAGWTSTSVAAHCGWARAIARRWSQWRDERRSAALRRALLEQDRHWERRLSFAGPPR